MPRLPIRPSGNQTDGRRVLGPLPPPAPVKRGLVAVDITPTLRKAEQAAAEGRSQALQAVGNR